MLTAGWRHIYSGIFDSLLKLEMISFSQSGEFYKDVDDAYQKLVSLRHTKEKYDMATKAKPGTIDEIGYIAYIDLSGAMKELGLIDDTLETKMDNRAENCMASGERYE